MGEYLTLAEAAEQLGVEYKTVYFLVRNGELPAGKVGRIYRIHKEDLKAYFDRQKKLVAQQAGRDGLTALEGLTCGACKSRILSELSIGGRCPVTAQPICQACWSIKKIRRCEFPVASGVSDDQISKASRPSTGKATMPVGDIAATIDRLRREGRPVTTPEEACLSEDVFLRGFAQRLEAVEELPDPLSGLAIHLRKARVKHQLLVQFKGDETLPGNRVSRFALKTGGWGRPAAFLVVEAHFVARPEVLGQQNYDADPIGEKELLVALQSLSQAAKKQNCFHVTVLGSPTGWDASAEAIVVRPGRGKGFADRRAAAVLWDLHGDGISFDTSDRRLWPFWPIIAPREFEAKVAGCVERIDDALTARNSLSLKDACSLCKADESWTHEAFQQIAAEGEYVLDDLEGIGPVLSRVGT